MGAEDHQTNKGPSLGARRAMKAFQCLVTLTSAQKGREQGTEGRIANTPQTRGDLILPLAMPQINSLL